MGHIPQATSGGSGHMLPSSTAWGLETPTPSKPADGGRGAADQWEEHSLPALPHLNAVETEPLALLTTGSHTPQGPERTCPPAPVGHRTPQGREVKGRVSRAAAASSPPWTRHPALTQILS